MCIVREGEIKATHLALLDGNLQIYFLKYKFVLKIRILANWWLCVSYVFGAGVGDQQVCKNQSGAVKTFHLLSAYVSRSSHRNNCGHRAKLTHISRICRTLIIIGSPEAEAESWVRICNKKLVEVEEVSRILLRG
jgi:hypothetical protein